MAASVGGLIADIGLNVAGLREDIKQANNELRRGTRQMNSSLGGLQKQVGSITGAFKGLVGVIGVALGARALAGLVNRTINSADQMLKLTQRLGGTTEAFSELKFVAERSGIEFNTLTMGLQRMTRRLAEAANDTGEAKDALRELGLDAAKVAALPLDRQFEVIADALSGVTSESDRVRLAMKLFDSEGVALLQTMENGSTGIRALREQARDLGLTLDQDTAEAATRAKDAMTNMRAAIDGLALNALPALAGALEVVATGWNRLLFGADPFPFEKQINAASEQIAQLEAQMQRQFPRGDPSGRSTRFQKLSEDLAAARAELERFMAKQREALGLGMEGAAATAAAAASGATSVLPTGGGQLDVLKPIDPATFTSYQALGEEVSDITSSIQYLSDEEIKAFKSMGKGASQLGDTLRHSLVDSATDAFLGIETDFGDMLRRMIARAAATKLFSALGDAGGAVGSFFGDFLGFEHGGSFVVGGAGGPDSQLVSFRATPGERVDVTPPGRGDREAAVHQTVTVNIQTGLPQQVIPELEAIGHRAGILGGRMALQHLRRPSMA